MEKKPKEGKIYIDEPEIGTGWYTPSELDTHMKELAKEYPEIFGGEEEGDEVLKKDS